MVIPQKLLIPLGKRAMLLGGAVIIGYPYAMAYVGGCLNIKDVDQIALQAARDKIEAY